MLETVCLRSVEDQSAMEYVDDYFKGTRKVGRVPNNNSKARVHAWLALETEPDKRLGEAGYWDLNHEAFARLGKFLESI